jgi:hypothetical protein
MYQGLVALTNENWLTLLAEAITHMPITDVNCVLGHANKDLPEEEQKEMSERDIRVMLVYLRYSNAICDQCSAKGHGVDLRLCPACKIVFYCSEECRAEHAHKHASRCCKPNAPLDDGPQQLVFARMKKSPPDVPGAGRG